MFKLFRLVKPALSRIKKLFSYPAKLFRWLFSKKLSDIEYVASVSEEGESPPKAPELLDFHEIVTNYINSLSGEHKADVIDLISSVTGKQRGFQRSILSIKEGENTNEVIVRFTNGDTVTILSKPDRDKHMYNFNDYKQQQAT